MKQSFRWGILGAGKIVRRWYRGAIQVDGCLLHAVASRSRETALRTAEELGIPHVCSYQELVQSPDIDIVYVALPHQAHREWAIRAMENHKHVLVEKPIAPNRQEAAEMIECARRNGVFLMEAVWTRFFPAAQKLQEILQSGEIGKVWTVQAAFSGNVLSENPPVRLIDPVQAGGGLLDVGVYPLHLADMVFREDPVQIMGAAAIDNSAGGYGVDEQADFVLHYPGGGLASLQCGLRVPLDSTAVISGENGTIRIPHFWYPTQLLVENSSGVRELKYPIECLRRPDCEDEGFQYEVRHVQECIAGGLKESPFFPWEKSLTVIGWCDTLRRQWGLRYPFENGEPE